MFGNGWRQHIEERQDRIESSVNQLTSVVGDIGGKIDKLSEGMTDTGERAAQRAQAVKAEMRDETDRKSKERNGMAMIGFGLLSAIALIVAALTGPWKEKLETTSTGQAADTAAIAAVREVLAQQGAGIGRNYDSNEIAREKNKAQDEQLRQVQHDEAYMQGWMSARYGYPGR
ncbi:hypothetical protein [Sphingomonas oryzagri]|nr:hypothetical protein [Sphingomonas oryzagri]